MLSFDHQKSISDQKLFFPQKKKNKAVDSFGNHGNNTDYPESPTSPVQTRQSATMFLRQPVSSETATRSGYRNNPAIQKSHVWSLVQPGVDSGGFFKFIFGIVATAEITENAWA